MGIVERSSFVPGCEHWESLYTYCRPMYLWEARRINCMEFQALHSNFSSSLITTFALKTLVLFLILSKLHNGRVNRRGLNYCGLDSGELWLTRL